MEGTEWPRQWTLRLGLMWRRLAWMWRCLRPGTPGPCRVRGMACDGCRRGSRLCSRPGSWWKPPAATSGGGPDGPAGGGGQSAPDPRLARPRHPGQDSAGRAGHVTPNPGPRSSACSQPPPAPTGPRVTEQQQRRHLPPAQQVAAPRSSPADGSRRTGTWRPSCRTIRWTPRHRARGRHCWPSCGTRHLHPPARPPWSGWPPTTAIAAPGAARAALGRSRRGAVYGDWRDPEQSPPRACDCARPASRPRWR